MATTGRDLGFIKSFMRQIPYPNPLRDALEWGLGLCLSIHLASQEAGATHVEIRRTFTTSTIALGPTFAPSEWVSAHALAVLFGDQDALRVLTDAELVASCTRSAPRSGGALFWEHLALALCESCKAGGSPLMHAQIAADAIEMVGDAVLRRHFEARYSPLLKVILAGAEPGDAATRGAVQEALLTYQSYWAGEPDADREVRSLFYLELSALVVALPVSGGGSPYLLPRMAAPRATVVACYPA